MIEPLSNKKKIAPSLLSADFGHLARDIKMVEAAGADLLHVDVMDGHFVPNLTLGPPIVKAINQVASIPMDVHLMITNPGQYVADYVQAGADYLTVHVEAATHLHRIIQQIKALGAKAGVALNPHTPLSAIEDILHDIDLVLIMSVNPGFGGQQFIHHTLNKLERLRHLLAEKGLHHVEIEVDGGIKLKNMQAVLDAGADILVSGSGIFKSDQPAKTIAAMRDILQMPRPVL